MTLSTNHRGLATDTYAAQRAVDFVHIVPHCTVYRLSTMHLGPTSSMLRLIGLVVHEYAVVDNYVKL